MTASLAPAYKNGLHQAALTLWEAEEVQVSFGAPGQLQLNDIVGFMDTRGEQDPAAQGPQRPREETLEQDVIFSVFRPGGAEVQKVASDRAYELLDELAHYVHRTDTTLGGAVRHCFLLRHDAESMQTSEGRTVEILATFGARGRITNI